MVEKVKLGDVFSRKITGEWGDECNGKTNGVGVLRTANFTNIGKIDYSNIVKRYVKQNIVEEKKLNTGDIILEKSGGTNSMPVGRVVYYDRDGCTLLCNNFTMALRVNKEIADSKYIFYTQFFLYQKGVTKKFENKTTGIHNLKTTFYLNQEILLPSLEEQQHIVKVLDTISDIIEKRKQQIAKLDELEKSLFIDMFGDPVTNPMGWETYTLDNLGYFKNGLNFGSDEKGISIYCVGVGDFKNINTISNISTLEKISLKTTPPDDYLLKDGDIIFVRSNGNKTLVGRSISIFPGNNTVTFSGFCIRFRINTQTIINEYLLHMLKSKSIRKAMHGRGANIQNLNQKILGLLSIPIPPLRYQEDFKYKMSIISNNRDVLNGSILKMQETYNALMQQYFE